MTVSQVYAKHMRAPISPKKVAPVADLVRGKDVEAAKIILTFDPTKAAALLLKVLKSAEANAVTNSKLAKDSLYVSEVWVSGGALLKRGRIVAKSRYNPVLKRTAHIYVGLSERADKKFTKIAEKKQAKPVEKKVKKTKKEE